MKALIFILFSVLVGCASAPVDLPSTQPESVAAGFGTLADARDPVELAAAPVYTQLALYRFTAAKQLRDGEITVDQARTVQRTADRIRSQLDAAVAARNVRQINAALTLLSEYQQ